MTPKIAIESLRTVFDYKKKQLLLPKNACTHLAPTWNPATMV
jgi:hypothetical protein